MIYRWSEAHGTATSSIVDNHREYYLRISSTVTEAD